MSFPPRSILLTRVKASILAILATLSTAANAPSAAASQLPWEQSPLAQAPGPTYLPAQVPSVFQPQPSPLQPIPTNMPAFALGPSSTLPGSQSLLPQNLQSLVQPIQQLQHPTLSTGVTSYNGVAANLPGFATVGTVGQWNAIPQTNAYQPLPLAPMENQLRMKEFLTNPAQAELMYAPQIHPAMLNPATYFPNMNLENPSEVSGEVL